MMTGLPDLLYCDTFGGFGISVLTIDCHDIKEILVDCLIDLVDL